MVSASIYAKKMHRVSSNFLIHAVVMLFIRSQTSRCDTINDCLEYTYDKCDFNRDDQQHLIEVINHSPSIDQCQFFCRSVKCQTFYPHYFKTQIKITYFTKICKIHLQWQVCRIYLWERASHLQTLFEGKCIFCPKLRNFLTLR